MSHPDFYAGLMDWENYGPRDGMIAERVYELAGLGLRLAEIEAVILAALDQFMAETRNRQLSP